MDEAVVLRLNGLARSSPWLHAVVGGLARWLAGLEITLMVLLALAGRRESAMRMLASVAVVYGATEAVGWFWPRVRPFARNRRIKALAAHSAGRSFPSRHVASGLAMAGIGTRAHHRLGTLMTVVAWSLGITRMAAGLHYPTDVIAGAAIGALTGRWLRQ